MSTLTLSEAATILGKTDDEMMFEVQNGNIQAGVDDDTLAWTFDLSEVLALKKSLETDEATGD